MSTNPAPSAVSAIGKGFRSLAKPPFRTLVLLAVLLAAVSTTFSEEPTETEMFFSFLLLFVSIYVQIALILAAGRDDPEPSADVWLRGAVRRRCFWRFVGTSLLVVLGLLAGAIMLVVGIFFVGALIGLAQSACVVERRYPMDAIARSANVANRAKLPIGIVFGLLVLVPTGAVQAAAFLEWTAELGALWPASLVVAELLTATGTIALTQMFVALGGEQTPAVTELAPTKKDPASR